MVETKSYSKKKVYIYFFLLTYTFIKSVQKQGYLNKKS